MWLLPTRGRSRNLKRFFAACDATEATTGGIVIVNDDDEDLDGYLAIKFPALWHLKIYHGQHIIWPKMNHFVALNPGEPWYGYTQDDCFPRTTGWDQKLIKSAGIDGMAFGDDGILSGKWATSWVIGGDLQREMIDEIGGIMLPGIKSLYADNFYSEYARRRNKLHYLPEVKMTHMHFSNGLADYDKTYVKTDPDGDKRIYDLWLEQSSAA